MFLTLKTIHMCCALISFTGFLFRAYLMVIDSKWLNHKLILVTPHLVDTIFLLSGFSMAFVLNIGLFAQGWLTMKIFLLMFYLLFVGIALNRGTTKSPSCSGCLLSCISWESQSTRRASAGLRCSEEQ
jgi:uncharacterized membrane protein SirB2